MQRTILALLFCAASYAQTAKFPAEVATDQQLTVVKNRVDTALLSAATATDTTFAVKSTAGILPNMLLSIDSEIVFVCSASGNLISVGRSSCPNVDGRAFDSTTAASHNANARVAGFIDAWHHNAITAEIKAIETALGASLGNVNKTVTKLSTSYDFAPLSPGGSLIVGNNSIALNPMPAGVNALSVNRQYLYIYDGVGTPEIVLVTGWSAGAVIVKCNYAHSGTWKIKSATAGISEAIQDSVRDLTIVGTNTVYGPVLINGDIVAQLTIRGQGQEVSALVRAAGFSEPPTDKPAAFAAVLGDVFFITGNARILFTDFGVLNSNYVPITSGAAIHVYNAVVEEKIFRNLKMRDERDGYVIEGVNHVTIEHPIFFQTPSYSAVGTAHAGIWFKYAAGLSQNSGEKVVSPTILGNNPGTDANTLQHGILVNAADGLTVGGGIIWAANAMSFVPGAAAATVNIIEVVNLELDNTRTRAILLDNSAFSTPYFGNMQFANLHVNSAGVSTTEPQIMVTGPLSSAGAMFSDIVQYNSWNDGFYLSSTNNVSIINSSFTNNNLAYLAGPDPAHDNNGIYMAGTNKNIAVTGCFLGYSSAAPPGGINQRRGIKNTGTLVDSTITGNTFANNLNEGIAPGTLSNSTISSNTFRANGNFGVNAAGGTLTGAAITGNAFAGHATAPITVTGATITGGKIGENAGIDDVVPTIASGAAVTLPLNPTVKISGVTQITTLNGGWTGCAKRLIFTDALPGGVGVGGNIGRTQAAAQNQSIDLVFDGTNWY